MPTFEKVYGDTEGDARTVVQLQELRYQEKEAARQRNDEATGSHTDKKRRVSANMELSLTSLTYQGKECDFVQGESCLSSTFFPPGVCCRTQNVRANAQLAPLWSCL